MKKGLVIGATLLASMAAQSAVLSTDKKIDVLIINGLEVYEAQKIDARKYRLPDAETQLVIQVEGSFGLGSNSEFYKSKPYFLTYDASQDATLQLPAHYRNKDKVKSAFRKNVSPAWRLKNSSGQPIAYETELLKGKEGFMPYADIPALVAQYNRNHGVVFDGQTLTYQEVVPTQVEDSTLKTLKYWFLDASEKEQQAFLDWAQNNKK